MAPPEAPRDRDRGRGAAPLAATLIAGEEERLAGARAADEVVLPDDLLPGVGGEGGDGLADEAMSLKEALRVGGTTTLAVVGAARVVDALDNTAMAVLAPDIKASVGVSDAVMGAIGGAFGVLFLLGSIPVSTLADRHPRKLVATASMALWTVVVAATAVVQNAFWLFVARLGTGISQSYALPVNAPLLIDTYPIPARSRVFAAYGSFEISGRVLAPLFAGGVAGLVAGPDSWRWVFVVAALLGLPVVVGLLRIREPRRGRNEMRAVLGHELDEDEGELPISVGVAFERLRKIRSFAFFLAGMSALGFALFSIPLFLNLYLEDDLGLSAWERGVFGSLVALPGVAALAVAGPRADRLYRRDPAAAIRFVGALIGGFGVLIVAGLYMPGVVLLGVFYVAGGALAQAAFVTIVSLVTESSRHFLYARVLLMALVAVSLTVLTGWAGQLSVGQFAFVGLGGMCSYALVQHRLAFPAAVLAGAAITAVAAVVVGAPALRMRGLFLAVSTLALAVATPWILTRPVFADPDHFSPLLRRPTIGRISLESQRTYYACLGVLAVVVVVVARVRGSGLGRSLLAVRDNELAAAAVGLSPTRVKLTAFALSGAIAGLAGGLLVGLLVQFSEDDFTATASMTVVAIAVVGGLASITGTVLGSLVVVGLPAFFPHNASVALLTSGAGLLILLLYFPGGLVQLLYGLRDLAFTGLSRRLDLAPTTAPTTTPAPTPAPSTAEGEPAVLRVRERTDEGEGDGGAVLRLEGVTVRFGARTVVDRVDLDVGPGEVVGLIGANGAGRTTLMNAVGGFVPSRGTIEVLGRDVQGLAPHRRAGLGLGRSFQDAALFADLTVRETVQTALETRARSGVVPVALGLPRARRRERAKRARADEILAFLGLGPYAERFVSELSTGLRRIVELACLLAVDARVLCLDEPTAGIAQREAEAFGPLLLALRTELDASMLVIEHDMPLVMSISDRIWCLEAGRVISRGTPTAVRSDPRVVASYLGTDERAIARSGSIAAGTATAEPSTPERSPA